MQALHPSTSSGVNTSPAPGLNYFRNKVSNLGLAQLWAGKCLETSFDFHRLCCENRNLFPSISQPRAWGRENRNLFPSILWPRARGRENQNFFPSIFRPTAGLESILTGGRNPFNYKWGSFAPFISFSP